MFRKLTLALAAAGSIGAAAFVPGQASALPILFPPHHHWHWGHFGWYGGGYDGGDGCYVVRRVVPTPFGPRLRRIIVCD